MKWLKEWKEKETTKVTILASWRMVHTVVEVAETVDAMSDPQAAIWLLSPLFFLTPSLARADDQNNVNIAKSKPN